MLSMASERLWRGLTLLSARVCVSVLAQHHMRYLYERPHNFIGTRVLPRVRLSDLARAGLETNCSRSTSARGRRHGLGLGKHANLIFYLDIERPAERAHARLLVSSAQPHTASMSMSYRLFPGHRLRATLPSASFRIRTVAAHKLHRRYVTTDSV